MAKARPKTPAAPEKDEKAAELVPAVEAEPPCPYLLSVDAFNRIFDAHSVPAAGSSESIDSIVTAAPATSAPTLKTTAEKFRLLQDALGVRHFDANARTAAWIDCCFGVLCFARQEGERNDTSDHQSHSTTDRDEDEKALLLLTITNDIFQFATTPAAATSTSDDNNTSSNGSEERHEADMPSVQLCYDKFRGCVRQVSSVRPIDGPDGTEQPHDHMGANALAAAARLHVHTPTLSTHEVARFVAFMSATFFRHLPAYQFVFRHARPSVTREMELFVETPFPPLPLAGATLIEADG